MGDTDDLTDLIRIKIKILHSITHTLSVDRTIPVLVLKDEISYYCGVSPERQYRLLFRGRVLKDGQRLSDYHVEEGHTLYLVKGPRILRFSSNAGNNAYNPQTSGRSREDQIASASHLAELVQTTRLLLINEISQGLSNISIMLVDQVNVTDRSTRRLQQGRAVELGRLLWNLGSSLLAIGRATSRISMGETQVDVGRAWFMSPTQQNRVEPRHSWLQTRIGEGRRVRVILRRRSSTNQEQSTEEELSASNSEHEMVNTVTS